MKRIFIIPFLFLLSLSFSTVAFFKGSSEVDYEQDLWPVFQKNDPTSTKKIDFRVWDRFLERNVKTVNGINVIDYAKVRDVDRDILYQFLTLMARVNILEYSRQEQLPYWINMHNALLINVILQHYPVESVRDIHLTTRQFPGPWTANIARIAGAQVSLHDIENRIVRPIWNDPRVIYLMYRGAIGYPILQKEAFTSDNLPTYLEKAPRDFINSEHGVIIKGGILSVSEIYEWYEEEFGKRDKHVLKHIRQYANQPLLAQLEDITEIDDTHFDWTINSVDFV